MTSSNPRLTVPRELRKKIWFQPSSNPQTNLSPKLKPIPSSSWGLVVVRALFWGIYCPGRRTSRVVTSAPPEEDDQMDVDRPDEHGDSEQEHGQQVSRATSPLRDEQLHSFKANDHELRDSES
ncbi:hypothetical protein B0H14DRAFT_2571450 [Mycena olivaceomarginata]|nr:hypothetical protein B0H14DRAFT_2571450 [Mycena olivaceomarginata]